MLPNCATFAADGGFLFATFKGEDTPMTEQVYFVLSKDGRQWEELNGGEPVLISKLGEKGVRDPFLLRSHDGEKFYIIATDLSANLNPDWRRASHAGSKSILIWESPDLVHWSEPRFVQVSPDDAGCTWAPEAVYDEDTQDYLMFWASRNGSDNFAKFRIWASRTKDFKTFGKPFIYIDQPHHVIDTDIVRDGEKYYRFSKNQALTTISMEVSDKLMGPWQEVSEFSLATADGYEGPQCFLLQPGKDGKPSTWCLLLDLFTKAEGYQPFVTSDLAGGKFTPASDFKFPFRLRHGSVLPLTTEEFARLQGAYQGKPDAAVADSLSWTNPLVPQRADPHIMLHTDGYYYFTATAPEYDRIEIRRARSIAGLSTAEPKVIWRKPASGLMSASIWAPELHFIEGKWYVYYTAGEEGQSWTSIRPYVLESAGDNPLDSQWTEKGQIKLGWDYFSLDGTTFAHRGVRYFVWTQIEEEVPGSNIYISRMDTPCSITGLITCLTRPDFEWERRGHWVNEGPAVLVKNGRVWMSYSASATDANYCVGLLSAADDADLLQAESWRKSPEPVFQSDRAASQFGPGHNSFTTSPDGKTDIFVYHARNYEQIQGNPLHNHDRATRAQVIRWRADGSPDFGTPVADGPYQP